MLHYYCLFVDSFGCKTEKNINTNHLDTLNNSELNYAFLNKKRLIDDFNPKEKVDQKNEESFNIDDYLNFDEFDKSLFNYNVDNEINDQQTEIIKTNIPKQNSADTRTYSLSYGSHVTLPETQMNNIPSSKIIYEQSFDQNNPYSQAKSFQSLINNKSTRYKSREKVHIKIKDKLINTAKFFLNDNNTNKSNLYK